MWWLWHYVRFLLRAQADNPLQIEQAFAAYQSQAITAKLCVCLNPLHNRAMLRRKIVWV